MPTLSTIAYSGVSGERDALEPVLFNRTNSFAFTGEARELRIASADLGPNGLRFSLVASTGHEVGLSEPDNLTFLLPSRGLLEVAVRDREFRSRSGEGLMFGPNTRLTRVIPDAAGWYEAIVLLLPASRIATLDPEDGIRAPAGISNGVAIGADTQLASLRGLLDFVRTDLSSPAPLLARPETAGALEVLLTEILGGLLGRYQPAPEATGGSRASRRKVCEAEEFMRANFARPLGLADIAAAVGTGLRSLQLAFRAVRGTTPREVLNEVRLAEARRMLQRGELGKSIADIALNCGIVHLGHFARAYRDRYGERPSDTLRRSGRIKAPERPQR